MKSKGTNNVDNKANTYFVSLQKERKDNTFYTYFHILINVDLLRLEF
jgi:hypothetical protein